MTYCALVISTNARDETALREMDKLQLLHNELTEPSVRFEKWLADLEDLDLVIRSSPILKDHAYFIKKIVENSKYTLSQELESLIANMTNTGSRAWAKLQNKLVSTLLVDIEKDGKA
jgi:oligoendopeptidase F